MQRFVPIFKALIATKPFIFIKVYLLSEKPSLDTSTMAKVSLNIIITFISLSTLSRNMTKFMKRWCGMPTVKSTKFLFQSK